MLPFRRPTGAIHLVVFAIAFAAANRPTLAQSELCANATPIGPGTFLGGTGSAAADGAATCGASNSAPDVWYAYTPATSAMLQIDTCISSYDTVVSVHSACPGTAANTLACNDDACALSSIVQMNVSVGTTYYIRVAGWNGASGSFVLNVGPAAPPQNDDCNNAFEVTDGTYTGITSLATVDGSASCADTGATSDLWYRYVPAADGTLLVDTCISDYDTVVSIHSGCPGTAGNELACQDNACWLSSAVATPVIAGNPCLIRVSGSQGASGVFTLHVQLPNPYLPGDMNCDSTLNLDDIDPFVLALLDPPAYAVQFPECRITNGDFTADAAVDGLDIPGFTAALLTP